MEPPRPKELELTEDEKAAKQYLYRLFVGDKVPCDETLVNVTLEHPEWIDVNKCKRGQQYVKNNRMGIFESHMVGLVSLLTHEKGLRLLCATGRSSTPETAKKRYAQTVLHTLSWYEAELVPGSESWKSLMLVRKMHMAASKMGVAMNLGFISQMEMAITQFGFMGFTLVRPHIFGLKTDNEEDIEAFIHLWAVFGYLLGMKDEFNLCLLPMNVVRSASKLILRYFMLPAIQLLTPNAVLMLNALFDGLKQLVPLMSFDVHMFLARRTCLVPGYQFGVKPEEETMCRSIFSEEECREILANHPENGYEYMEFVFQHKIPLYTFSPKTVSIEINGNTIEIEKDSSNYDSVIEAGQRRPMEAEFAKRLREYLQLDQNTNITLTLIDYETEWSKWSNDSKLYELDKKVQKRLRVRETLRGLLLTTFGRYIVDWLFSLLMWRFQRFLNSNQP